MSHNAKYYVKSFKRNKVKLSDIRGLWKKKKYSEENIVLVHWQILQLVIFAKRVRQVCQKKDNVIKVSIDKHGQNVSVNLRDLCQISLQWNSWQWNKNLLELQRNSLQLVLLTYNYKIVFASICFTFASYSIKMKTSADECFWDYYFVLDSNGLCKKRDSFRSCHHKVFYKIRASFLKEL